MKEIRLFVASSCELKTIRDNLVLKVTGKNKLLAKHDVRIEIDEWEFESTSITSTGRDQDKYNRLIGKADLIAVILRNKVGKYTREEFDIALTLFRVHGKPIICIYTLPAKSPEKSLSDFLTYLRDPSNRLDKFPCIINNKDALWNEINGELDRLISDTTSPLSSGSNSQIQNTFNGPVGQIIDKMTGGSITNTFKS